MRVTGVKVLEIIVHALPRGAEPSLSQVPIPSPPESDPRIFEYFAKHISNSLNNPQCNTAKFEDLGSAQAQVCGELVSGKVSLVDGSKQLARTLHGIVQKDDRISTGDLAVCLCEVHEITADDAEKAEDGPTKASAEEGEAEGSNDSEKKRYLALMKMDPATGFRQVRERDQHNNPYVSFSVEEQIMPREGEPLQKCAFVRSVDPESYHMLLLDRQIRTKKGLEVATFFKADFLQAKLALDPPKATAKLYDAFKAIEADVEDHMPREEHEELAEVNRGALQLPEVNLDDHLKHMEQILDRTRVPAKVKGKAKRRLSTAAFPDQVVKTHQPTVEEKEKREETVWQGDENLRLVVPATFPGTRIQEKKKKDAEKFGGEEYYEISIETKTWKKLS